VPAFSFDHNAAARLKAGFFPKAALNLFQNVGFSLLPLPVQTIELGG